MDLLQQSALAWKEIIEYQYLFTYGYKKQLHPISLTFSLDDYPHLAGFQYMKDISLPNYSSAKIADRILEGKILFENEDINSFKNEEIKNYRKKVQMIFQDPYASMNPRFKIKDILKEPLYIHKIEGNEETYNETIINALKDVKINTDFMEVYPHMLSGGQRQRIATARALILNPKLVIADEPVSMIDLSTRAEILYMMKELQEKRNLSYIYITHDLSTARYFADRIAVMYLGKIIEIGSADEIIDNPKHPYTKALIEAVPNIEVGRVNVIKELPIKGEIPNASDIPSGCRFHTRCIYAKEECKLESPILKDINDNHKSACLFKDI